MIQKAKDYAQKESAVQIDRGRQQTRYEKVLGTVIPQHDPNSSLGTGNSSLPWKQVLG